MQRSDCISNYRRGATERQRRKPPPSCKAAPRGPPILRGPFLSVPALAFQILIRRPPGAFRSAEGRSVVQRSDCISYAVRSEGFPRCAPPPTISIPRNNSPANNLAPTPSPLSVKLQALQPFRNTTEACHRFLFPYLGNSVLVEPKWFRASARFRSAEGRSVVQRSDSFSNFRRGAAPRGPPNLRGPFLSVPALAFRILIWRPPGAFRSAEGRSVVQRSDCISYAVRSEGFPRCAPPPATAPRSASLSRLRFPVSVTAPAISLARNNSPANNLAPTPPPLSALYEWPHLVSNTTMAFRRRTPAQSCTGPIWMPRAVLLHHFSLALHRLSLAFATAPRSLFATAPRSLFLTAPRAFPRLRSLSLTAPRSLFLAASRLALPHSPGCPPSPHLLACMRCPSHQAPRLRATTSTPPSSKSTAPSPAEFSLPSSACSATSTSPKKPCTRPSPPP